MSYFTHKTTAATFRSGRSGTLKALYGGGYQLTAADGSITAFNANGTLNYVQDSNGNRITAGYNSGGQMTSLTDSDGDASSSPTTAKGFSARSPIPGETASYTYDAAGHLLSVTTPQERPTYRLRHRHWAPAPTTPCKRSLNPDGTQLNYTYDSEGPAHRLLRRHRRQPH